MEGPIISWCTYHCFGAVCCNAVTRAQWACRAHCQHAIGSPVAAQPQFLFETGVILADTGSVRAGSGRGIRWTRQE